MTPYLLKELAEQPAAVARVFEEAPAAVAPWTVAVGDNDPIVFLARGTSDNAARYGGYLLAIRNRRLSSLALPAVITRYERTDLFSPSTPVVAISQSGSSPDLVTTLRAARDHGSPTLTITNSADSPLADVADHVVDLACGPERAVAATKSYTASLAALVALSDQLGAPADNTKNEAATIEALEAMVRGDVDPAAAHLLGRSPACMVVGRGFQLATAHETALKIQELTRIVAQPFSPADLEHGPIAALGPQVPLILIATTGPMLDHSWALIDRARHRASPIIVVSDSPQLLESGDAAIPVPRGIPERLSPIVTIVALQRLAIQTAQALGVDLDNPHGLTKITRTR